MFTNTLYMLDVILKFIYKIFHKAFLLILLYKF